MSGSETDDAATCGARYGQNPDACYLPAGHDEPHRNRYGTTWED